MEGIMRTSGCLSRAALGAAFPLTSLLALAVAVPAQAGAQINASPWSERPQRFDLHRTDLDSGLTAFANQAGVQLVVNVAGIRGLSAHSVVGMFTRTEALRRLIGNQDVTVVWTARDTLAVRINRAVEPQADIGPTATAVPMAPVDNSADGTGDIVVTAQRREQRLQDVPISVSVASGSSVQKSNITTLEQLTARLPTVKISATPASDQLHIRGTGSGLNPGFEQSVATFVDGAYRGRARSSRAALFDVERVEVLKGPQTTFFGNNAIAGAFNITTRKPSKELGLNATALYSPSDGEYNLEAGVDLPLSPELRVRLSGRASGMDGYIRNTNLNEDGPHLRDMIGRVNIVWEPSPVITSTLRVDVIHNRDRGTYYAELLNCPADPVYGATRGLCAAYLAASGGKVDDQLNYRSASPDSFFRYDAEEIAFSNDIGLGDHILSLNTTYFHHKAENGSNLIPIPLPGLFGAPSLLPFYAPETLSQFTQEVRLTSPRGQDFEYMVGAYYLHGKLFSGNLVGYNFAPFGNLAGNGFPVNTPLDAITLMDQRENTVSVFGSATYHITPALRVSAGMRYSRVRKTASRSFEVGVSSGYPNFDGFIPAPPAAQPVAAAFVGNSILDYPVNRRVDDAFLPSMTVQYDVAPDAMVYASFSKGFKAGGFSGTTRDVFKPEKVDAYEVGLKSQFFNRALTVNVAAFLSNYKDLQEASQIVINNGATVVSVVGNSASSRAQGVELGASLRVSDNLNLHGEMAYLDSHYVSYKNAPCTVLGNLTPRCIQDLSGKKRPFAPKWSGSVGLTLTKPLQDAQITIDPVLNFSSRYHQQTFDPLFDQPGYAKIDLRFAVGKKDRGWELAVIGRNLTDEATAAFRNQIPTSPGTIIGIADRGRSVAIQFTIQR
jgi:iron complex outermembrane receptor protein